MQNKIETIRSQDEFKELYEFATIIRNQKLLTDAELESLTRHKQDVFEASIKLLTKAWRCSTWNSVGRQLKCQMLDPTLACKLLKEINETEALPAHKHMGHYFSNLSQLLTILYNEPMSVAALLNNVDQNDIYFNDCVIQALFHMVYACGLYPEDDLKLAQVVCFLLKLQLMKYGDQMRTMLRKESSMSTRFYKHFVEQMHPSMVYLTRALRRGVLEVIQLGSFWLDIDSKQSTTRFLRDNKQNAERLPEYRALVISKLVELVDIFLENISQALPMLPPNLNWVLRDIYCSLSQELDDSSTIELSHACKDMIISNFICPAIISPQKFGIVDNDVRIGTIVNHNLVQIAMIIQMISLREFETPPEEYTDFLKQCRKTHLISDMMDAILVEQLAPDVEILVQISGTQEKTDIISKPNFVGSVADVNILIKLIADAEPIHNKNIMRIVDICKKLPKTFVSLVSREYSHTNHTVTTPSFTFSKIHQKVQHSLKSTGHPIENQKTVFSESTLFDKSSFDLFYLEYTRENYSNVSSSTSAFSIQLENDNNSPEKTDETEMEQTTSENETKFFSKKTLSQEEASSTCETEKIPNVCLELQSKPEPKGGFNKLKNLGDIMKKGITQSNTLADIREHLRRSGSSIIKENGIVASQSDQSLSLPAHGPRDDILAKYAPTKSSAPSKTTSSRITELETHGKESEEPYYCPENLISCRAFQDTVRKMSTVLGNVSYLPRIGYRSCQQKRGAHHKKFLLDQFLEAVLVETEHRRDYGQAAQLREVKRCIELFDDCGVEFLFDHLKIKASEQDKTIAHMREERAGLMRTANDISSLEQRVLLNQQLTEEIIVDNLTRIFLETGFHTKNGKTPEVAAVLKFYDEFKLLQTHDEQAEFLKNLLIFLKQRLMQNSDWSYASDSMALRAITTIERYVMFSVYDAAFYPNKELDQHKDKLLRMTIANLANAVTPENGHLKVPKRLHGEAPWPSAQAELTMLDMYVTAQDKLNCVVRCCDVINNLIALSSKNATASADDLTPVLVFVIIKANPRALLSNLQFVETFAGDSIESGRDAYYWTNFKAAVEYIKTIL